MRLSVSLAALMAVCVASGVACGAAAECAAQQASATSCETLHLIPAPRECDAVAQIALGDAGIEVTSIEGRGGHDAEDAFAAEDLAQALKARGVEAGRHGKVRVRLLRADTHDGRALLERNHLAFDAAMHDEGYVLVPDGKRGLAVIAETAAGEFYGAQTVKQLVRGAGRDAVLLTPTLRDWPAMPHRGVSDDWSRGPMPNMDFLKRELRTMAAYKLNTISPYFEATFAYASTPVAAFPGGAMTPDEARQMVAYAAKYHITVIPEQESFGHLHHVLKFEEYSPLGETPHGAVLAPGDPRSLPLIASWFGELAKVFPGPYAHIGADETFELGMGRTRDEVKAEGLDTVYLNFLKQIHTALAPDHKRLLFWGDIAEKSPEKVGILPKDMIAVPWHYDAEPDFTKAIKPFVDAGLETWVATGVNNWNRVFPDNNVALANIRVFVRDGQRLGAKGVLNTVWNDDGEGIFDENWYGVLFGAAAGWQKGESPEASFEASYGLAFHGDATGKIDEAEQALMAAHAVLHEAGLEDVQDSYFWVDPFSPEGEQVSAKLLPAAHALRLDAERAITLVAQARAAAKANHITLRNEAALDAMGLGARRMDFVGMKFQAADDCEKLYARAQALAADKANWNEVSDLLETIGSNNGRLEDIRDGYSQIGELFRKAWLRDERRYWLANNEDRYARATELWIGRSRKWNTVIQHWWDTHTLPPAGVVGLPEVAGAAGGPAGK